MKQKEGYKILNLDEYYRKDIYRRFTKVARSSVSITHRIDVTALAEHSRRAGTKFYINFLYLLVKVLNSREDYRMGYLWQTDQVVIYDKINPCQYVFHEDTETCTPVYTEYDPDYETFYEACKADIENARQTREFLFDMEHHPNWFDASYIPWVSYEALHVELPDGYLYYQPIINWGRYEETGGRLKMPVTVRMNHAVADGYLISKVFLLIEEEIKNFVTPSSSLR